MGNGIYGFVDGDGDFVTFEEIAKDLPDEYPSIGEYDLPTSKERAVLLGQDRFYDFFQIIFIDEDDASNEGVPYTPGWYWVTYFSNMDTALGWLGPFSDEHRALNHACSHALPLNDRRRQVYKYGYIGSGIEMCGTRPKTMLDG